MRLRINNKIKRSYTMRLIKRTVSAFLAVLFLFSINVIQVSADTATDEVNIVFTSDLHSNV